MWSTTKVLRSIGSIALGILGSIGAAEGALSQTEPEPAGKRAEGQAAMPASAKDGAGRERVMIEEVLVTARKREESLQDVPLSVVAVSGEQLERRSIENLEDLGQSTPNFQFAELPQSGRVAGIAFIRGVGQRDPISAYDPAVGIYVDGVYIGRMYANNLDMLDTERVEVLRGPQGTLFGKNTSGGAINIVTRKPDASADALFGRLQLTTGSRDRADAIGSVNIPVVTDRLALQVAASRLTQDGYGRRIDGQEMANTDRSAAHAQLLFQPTERLSALLSGDWTESDERNGSFKLVDTNPTIPPLAALNTLTTQRYDDRWLSPGDYIFGSTGPNLAKGRLRGTALTLTYDASWATLKSISAYRDLDVENNLDPEGSPVEVLNKFERTAQEQVSQELQITGTSFADRLEWVAGIYYFHEEIDQFEAYDLLTPLFNGTRDFARVSPIENDSLAGYGQGSYALTDKLRLTAGVRYTEDRKDLQSTQYGGPAAVEGNGTVQFATPTGEHDSSAVSPRLGFDYRWTPEIMTYVSVAHGAKNGGFNGRVGRLSDFTEFDDEEVWTCELGARSDLLDGRVRLNATAFYSRYRDLQLQISGSTVVNGAPASFGVITNIPKVRITGGEAELVIAPARGFTFTGGLGLTYGEFEELPTDDKFIASRVINEDSELSHVPEVSYTLGAEYATALGDALGFTGRVDFAHRSRIYYNSENTANLIQPAYGLLNARVTFEHERSGLSVSVFGTNLTDERYIVGGFDDAANPNPGLGFSLVTQGAPREWGVSAQLRF